MYVKNKSKMYVYCEIWMIMYKIKTTQFWI